MNIAVAKSFTAVGNGGQLFIRSSEKLAYSVSGTFVGTVQLRRSKDGFQSDELVSSHTAAASSQIKTLTDGDGWIYRFVCSAYTSGTIVTSLAKVPAIINKIMINAAVNSKPGTTSGFLNAAADNISLVTCPASKTGSTLVIPIPRLREGDVIVGFHLVGQIESGGNHATVDASLRKHVAAAADVTDGLVAAITQLDVTADAIMSDANTLKEGLGELVQIDESYYVLVTVTTAAATDIALQGVVLLIASAA